MPPPRPHRHLQPWRISPRSPPDGQPCEGGALLTDGADDAGQAAQPAVPPEMLRGPWWQLTSSFKGESVLTLPPHSFGINLAGTSQWGRNIARSPRPTCLGSLARSGPLGPAPPDCPEPPPHY
uniref:Uncharacterized protein n=1 Tax=Sphaerodactylus townsendi TaxID=933632 RepID=A0ACB8F104_9SAUR